MPIRPHSQHPRSAPKYFTIWMTGPIDAAMPIHPEYRGQLPERTIAVVMMVLPWPRVSRRHE
jgi:hypothetical protein